MTTSSISAQWHKGRAFVSRVGSHEVCTDAPVPFGGLDSGANPKALMMVSLAGCTGVDVAMILEKMRIEVADIVIEVTGQLSDETPSVYTAMHLVYIFSGKGLKQEKLEHVVELSQEKYCGVSFMYRKIMTISWEVRIVEA